MAANDRQVGGKHYSNGMADLQHWDIVDKFDLDYFQGQVTKYLFRWKKKGLTPEARMQDLEKAQHFLEKYIEVQKSKMPKIVVTETPSVWPLGQTLEKIQMCGIDDLVLSKPGLEMSLAQFERNTYRYLNDDKFRCEGGYGNGRNLYTCLQCKHLVNALSLEDAAREHACTPPATLGAPPAV